MAALPLTATATTSGLSALEGLSTKNPSSQDNWILNDQGCYIKIAEGKGRGVFGEQSQFL